MKKNQAVAFVSINQLKGQNRCLAHAISAFWVDDIFCRARRKIAAIARLPNTAIGKKAREPGAEFPCAESITESALGSYARYKYYTRHKISLRDSF